mgnify:FL=1
MAFLQIILKLALSIQIHSTQQLTLKFLQIPTAETHPCASWILKGKKLKQSLMKKWKQENIFLVGIQTKTPVVSTFLFLRQTTP